jgi:thiol-disulfide isomerase/thioredoxin
MANKLLKEVLISISALVFISCSGRMTIDLSNIKALDTKSLDITLYSDGFCSKIDTTYKLKNSGPEIKIKFNKKSHRSACLEYDSLPVYFALMNGKQIDVLRNGALKESTSINYDKTIKMIKEQEIIADAFPEDDNRVYATAVYGICKRLKWEFNDYKYLYKTLIKSPNYAPFRDSITAAYNVGKRFYKEEQNFDGDYHFLTLDKDGNLPIAKFINNIVYVTFWVSTCPHCMKEIHFNRTKKRELIAKGVKFLYVCADPDIIRWKKLVKSKRIAGYHMALPNLLLDNSNYKRIVDWFDIKGFPFSILFGKDGKVIKFRKFTKMAKPASHGGYEYIESIL